MTGNQFVPRFPYSRCNLQDLRYCCQAHVVTLTLGLISVAHDNFGTVSAREAPPTYTRAGTAVILPQPRTAHYSQRHSPPSERFVMEIKALVANSSNKERKNITRSLKEIGVANVVEATDGNQAMELLQTGKFDVLFAEYNTKINNQELVKTVRTINGQLPIIVTAPQSKKMDELKKVCPNASNYITMPFTTDQLRTTVKQYVPSLAV
jgi:two-component system chemotaxis response regulator CheY